MTVPATDSRAGPFSGTGVIVPLPFDFKVFAQEDVLVTRTDINGFESTLVIGVDYTVTLNPDQDADPGGEVTPVVAPAVGELTTLTSGLEYEQPIDLVTGGKFRAQTVEDGFDRTTMLIKQLKEQSDRTLHLPISAEADATLPVPEANALIGWNETGDALQNVDPAGLATIVAFGTAQDDLFSGDGTTTAFALTSNPGAQANLKVSIGGLDQRPGLDYAWSGGTTLTFTTPPPAGVDNILVKYQLALPQGYTTDDLVSVQLNAPGSVPTTQRQINEEVVRVTRFMSPAQIAAPSGSDCSAAVQAAVDYCLDPARGGHIPVLEVPCFIRLDASVNIDRPVDTTSSEFRIRAVGRLGGFYTTTPNLKMFSSTIAHVSDPVSECVTFEGIHFESNDNTNLNDAVDGDKFLRMKFIGCYFLRTRGATATGNNRIQSYTFDHCQMRQWRDWFVSGNSMFDVHASLNLFEHSVVGKGFSSFDPAVLQGASGCSFTGNLFENCFGPFLSLMTPQGILVSGNYFEGNDSPNFDFSQGRTLGVAMHGNFASLKAANIANVNFYDVKIGECYGFTGGGNYCDGRLYDFTHAQAWASIGHGDLVSQALFRGSPSHVIGMNTWATHIRFPATQVQSTDPNTLDDYEEGTWTSTISSPTNCSAVTVTTATYTKIGRQVSIQMSGTLTVTAGTTFTGFVSTIPFDQGAAADPAVGTSMIASNGVGFVYDNTGANPTQIFVAFPANQVLAAGAGQGWRASLTYNAAT